jgi:hypothetical protein
MWTTESLNRISEKKHYEEPMLVIYATEKLANSFRERAGRRYTVFAKPRSPATSSNQLEPNADSAVRYGYPGVFPSYARRRDGCMGKNGRRLLAFQLYHANLKRIAMSNSRALERLVFEALDKQQNKNIPR